MKKRNIIILVLISLLLIVPSYNVSAADKCKGLSKKVCKNVDHKDICEWKKADGKKQCVKIKSKNNKNTSSTDASITFKDVSFCKSTSKIWKIVGKVLMIVKIVIPILLIVLATIDFSKAVMASNDDGLKKAAKSLLIRSIIAITIFFVPTIVTIIIQLFVNFANDGVQADYEICRKCITNPNGCNTSSK